jgi:hypothetical protein
MTYPGKNFLNVLDEMVGLLVVIHLHHDVSRKELSLRGDLAAPPDLDDLFQRHGNFLDQIAESPRFHFLLDRRGDLFLKA